MIYVAVNKVDFYGDTLIDISDTTAEESSVVAGKTFYKATGARAIGTADYQPKITTQTVSLSSSWSGSGPYYQTILTGQAAGLQVNLNPTIAQLEELADAGVTSMVAANENGTVKIYAAGAAPAAMSLQITKIITY